MSQLSLQEASALLSISRELTGLRDTKMLLKAIYKHIRPIFPYDTFGLFVVTEDGRHHYELVDADIMENDAIQAKVEEVYGAYALYDHPDSPVETMMTEGPKVFPLKRFIKHTQGPIMYAAGLRELIGGPLYFRGKAIGMLCFNTKQEGFYTKEKLPMFCALSDQLGVVAGNILEHTALLKEKGFKEILLTISEAATRIRDREGLYNAIMQKIRPIVQFDDAVFITFSKDFELHNHMLTSSSGERKGHPLYRSIVEKYVPTKDTPIQEMLEGDDFQYMDTKTVLRKFPQHEGMLLMRDTDLNYSITIKLYKGSEFFALLVFHFKHEITRDSLSRQLYTNIADQISVALSNVLANEALLQEKLFSEALLGISEVVTHIRNREHIFAIMAEKIRPLLQFDDSVVLTLTEDGQAYENVKTVSVQERKEHPLYYDIVHKRQPIKNSPLQDLLNGDDGRLHELKDFEKKYPKHPGVILMKDTGLAYTLATKLKKGGKVFGLLQFHYKEKPFFTNIQKKLLPNIADQISVAMSNVMANETILEEKKFSETLLTISEAATRIRDREGLYKAIMEQIRPIVQFDDTVVITFSEDYERATHLISLSPEATLQHPNYKKLMHKDVPVGNGPFKEMIHQINDIQPYDLAYWLDEYPDFDGFILMKDTHLDYSVVCKLKSGGTLFALLIFHFTSENVRNTLSKELYANIADQISVAVSNVLANETILEEKRFSETLLGINEAVTLIRDRQHFFATVTEKIKPLLNYDDAVVAVLTKDKKKYTHILTVSPGERMAHPMYWEIVEKALPVKDSPMEELFNGEDGAQYHLKDWLLKYPDHPGIRLMKDTGLHHSIPLKLRKGGDTYGILLFHFNEEIILNNTQKKLFPNIADQMSVAISNVLANEEIMKREREKTLLLQITEQVTKLRHFPDFLGFLHDHLKPLFNFHDCGIFLLSEDNKHHYDVIAIEDIAKSEWNTALSQMNVTLVEHKGSVVENMMVRLKNEQSVLLLDFKDLAERYPDYYQFKIPEFKKMGYRDCLAANLVVGEKVLGMFCINALEKDFFKKEQFSLFKSVTDQLSVAISNILANEQILQLNEQLLQEKEYLEEEIKTEYNFETIIGGSTKMQEVFEKVDQVSRTDTTVLVLGETGTGKELIARALHDRSPRKERPLIKLNCATLPAQLLESELFGHERGSFTGAMDRRIGKFELADKSSIFLDEIGEMNLELQAKLLRVLQEKEFERVGGNKIIQTDVRIIAATNRNLEKEIADGKFRADLYYRLHVFPITLPPLRDRTEDIPHLALHFLNKYGPKVGKRFKGLSNTSVKEMLGYDWPGNIRELEHMIERAIITAKGTILDLHLDKATITKGLAKNGTTALFQQRTFKEAERELLMNTLGYCGGRIRGEGGAAEILDMHPSTLESRMRKLGIKREHVVQKK